MAPRWAGNRIVYPGNVQRPSEDYGYYKIEPGTEIVVPMARPDRNVVAYWINADVLKQYLQSLQADEKLRTNVVFQVQLLKLIQDANKQLDANISESYQAPEKQDNYPLDQVPNPMMADSSAAGNVLLTYGDLKTTESFNGWLQRSNMGVGSKENTLRDSDKFMRGGGHCNALKILYYRAIAHLRTSVRPEDTERFKIAMKELEKLAPLFQCNLKGGQSAQPGQEGDESQGGAPMTLEELASMQVFNARFIDVRVIKQFVDNYAAWGAANKKSNAVRLKADFDGAVSQGQTAVRNLMSPIMLSGVDRQQFTNLYTTNASYFTLAINHLASIVSSAQRALQDFIVVYSQNHGGMAGSAAQNLNRQVAIAQQNINDLMRIQSQPQPTPPYRR